MFSPHRTKLLLLVALLVSTLSQTQCLEFDFPNFTDYNKLILGNNSAVANNAIQVTSDLSDSPSNTSRIANLSGRVLYHEKLVLWTRKGANAEFNTSFVINISNKTTPGGEGLAFILTDDYSVPESSSGQWLGIVSPELNGSSQASNTVAIEFDTRKSYPEDLDDNHVGLDVNNSVYSIKQVTLSGRNVTLSSGVDVSVVVQYDGTRLSVFAGNDSDNPVLSMPIDLSAYLPRKVYVGFSGSTSNYTETNCVTSWNFTGGDMTSGDGNVTFWVALLVALVLLVAVFGVAFNCWRRRVRRLDLEVYPSIEDEINGSSTAPIRFKLKELRKATGKFSPKNQLGRGGFGTVYKGTLGGKEVAVKRIHKDKAQGKQEFISEVTTIGNLHHRNLVKLIGWCYERSEFLIVYEYMPNGSLEKLIFADENSDVAVETLSWKKRVNIVSGVAQAVEYLHNGCEKMVLHRDIKASNIMLDSDFDARLGDFGLARIIKQKEQTHHSTEVLAGTFGYMAPEFLFEGKATIWTDVYAFGILVLEVACGRKPACQSEGEDYISNIVNWVWELHGSGAIVDAADPRLKGDFEKEDMERLLVLGLACCHPNPNNRPSMKAVHQVLKGEAPPPDVPSERPRFVWPVLPPSSMDKDMSLTGGQLAPFSRLTGR